MLDAEGISLPSDGPEYIVTVASHPPPAWLTWDSHTHQHHQTWPGCLLDYEARSLAVIHSYDGETKA